MKTCALCGGRDAVCNDEWDGRMVPHCAVCLTPPADPAEPDGPHTWSTHPSEVRTYRLGLLARYGPVSAAGLAGAMGLEDRRGRLRIIQFLWKLADQGAIDCDRSVVPHVYSVRRADVATIAAGRRGRRIARPRRGR